MFDIQKGLFTESEQIASLDGLQIVCPFQKFETMFERLSFQSIHFTMCRESTVQTTDNAVQYEVQNDLIRFRRKEKLD